MSTPERTDDPGEHGYGAAKQGTQEVSDVDVDVDDDGDDDRTEAEPNPSRRERESG